MLIKEENRWKKVVAYFIKSDGTWVMQELETLSGIVISNICKYGGAEEGKYTLSIMGPAMMKGESTYYKGMSESYPEIFMGTCLQEQSRNCEIEIFSEELDMEFSEHYYLKNGKLVLDDCKDIHKGRNPNRNGWEYNFKYQYIH